MRKALFEESHKKFVEEQECILHRAEFEIFTVSTAEEALELHKRERMSLIVVDLDFPEMGGDKLCEIIKADSDLKRVYVSLVCAGSSDDLERCSKAGADSYIKRPPMLTAVTDKICRILETQERRDRRVLVKVDMHGTYRAEPFFCISKNLSSSGVLFESDRTLARGDQISLSFILPDATKFDVGGVVKRVLSGDDKINRYGVAFQDIMPGLKDTLETFMKINGGVSRL